MAAEPNINRAPAKSKALTMLAATVGLGTATQLMLDTRHDEGEKLVSYRDGGCVWTLCSGTTRGVKQGQRATTDQCDALTAADLVIAVRGVERCAPGLKDPARHNQLRAAVRFNNNTGKFCRSPGRLMNQHLWRQGCDAMLRYVYVQGRYVQGLANRRAREHAICVAGL